MVDCEPWSVAKVDHGHTPRLYHSQPWSTMVKLSQAMTVKNQLISSCNLVVLVLMKFFVRVESFFL